MKHKLQYLATKKLVAVLVVYIVCLILITFNLINAYHLRPFTSDDVFWQVILRSWHPFTGSTVTLGNSSVYVDKIPLYELLNHFIHGGRRELFAEAAIETWIGFSAFYFAAIYFLRKCKARLNYITLLPFIWFSSFGYMLMSLYLNPNWRGFQIGISFGAFALVAALLSGDIKTRSIVSKVLLVLFSLFAGLQTYSDPYFLYFTVGPIILMLIVLIVVKVVKRTRVMPIIIALILTLLSARVFGVIAKHAGVRTSLNYPMQFIAFHSLPANTLSAFQGILQIFSGDFFGLNVVSLPAIVAVFNFITLGFATCIVVSILTKARRLDIKKLSFNSMWLTFFAFVGLIVFLTFTISTLSQGTSSYRYFLMLVLIFVLILAVKLGTTKSKYLSTILTVVLLAASLLNLYQTKLGNNPTIDQQIGSNKANSSNYTLIAAVESRGYSKGYANYWQANINTYLSDGKVSFLPSLCAGTETEKFIWLINNSAFYAPATKSFYLEDPSIKAPATCSLRQIEAQFGQPAQTEMIGDKTILFYNYDITLKIPNFVY